MSSFINEILHFVHSRGTSLLICIVALVLGMMAVNNVLKLVRRVLINSKLDDTIVKLSLTVIKIFLYFMIMLYIVSTLGIKLTGFIAVFSALSLAVGLAIQDVISGVANGIVIVSSKPFKVGDHVKIGSIEGKIREIRIMYTVIDTFDRVQIFLPNKTVYNADISNFTTSPLRRLDFEFGVDYDTDMNMAKEILLQTISNFKYALNKPDYSVFMKSLEDSSVVFIARFWVKNEDYWAAKGDFNAIVFEEFKKNGISIPFPQITLSSRDAVSVLPPSKDNSETNTNEQRDNI